MSVTFNSMKFWALVIFQVCLISLLQGGLEVDVEWLMKNCIKGKAFGLKAIVLKLLADMPPELLEEVIQYPYGALYPLDLELKLIRSRAVVLQLTWSESEIKLSSEFQTVSCAFMAVLSDIMFDYFQVGEEFIISDSSGKKGLLFIFLVSLGSRFVGQAVARRRLKEKV